MRRAIWITRSSPRREIPGRYEPAASARAWLIQAGHDSVHVGAILGPNALDIAIWRNAKDSDRAIVTKDADFLRLAITEDGGPPVVLVRCGNLGLRALHAWFSARLLEMIRALEAGERVVELA